jgi:hypothetical protein
MTPSSGVGLAVRDATLPVDGDQLRDGVARHLDEYLREIPRSLRELAVAEAASALDELLDLDIDDVVVAAWDVQQDLRDAATRSTIDPEATELVHLPRLSAHAQSAPSLRIECDGRRLATVTIGLNVEVALENFCAAVRAGVLTRLTADAVTITAELLVEGEVLARRVGHIDIATDLPLGHGIRLADPTGDRGHRIDLDQPVAVVSPSRRRSD